MSRLIGNNIDYSGKCTAPVETEKELKAYVKEKMSIVDDFLIGKRKLKGNARHEFEAHMRSLKSTRAIDIYFKDFIKSHM